MNSLERITFVSAVNDRNILEANLLASPVFQLPHAHQVLVQEGFECGIGLERYNDVKERDIIEAFDLEAKPA